MPASNTSPQIFSTPVGNIQAYPREKVLEALGIPYARAQRFGYPYPVEARDFSEPYLADQPAPAAPQHIRGGGKPDIRQSVLMSEDCQNLSVIMPADISAAEKLPVMVYIHGGSYIVGSGDGARYNPDKLIAEHRVIVVRVTYRLGILGFLGGTEERPANLGLLDVREALGWVKRNIASFGGDPENITVFGQSAGGDLIASLIVSDGVLNEELFQRAIIQSAPLDIIKKKTKLNQALLSKVSQELAPDAPAEEYGELAYKLNLQNPLKYGLQQSMMAFGTQPGHYPMPAEKDLEQVFQQAAGKIDLLIGSNLRESAYFGPSKLRGRKLRALEPLVKHFSWLMYAVPAQRVANDFRAAGGNATRYYLRTGHPLHRWYSAHCTELGLLFDNPSWQGSDLFAGAYEHEYRDQALALRTIWADFAKTGTIRQDLAEQARLELS